MFLYQMAQNLMRKIVEFNKINGLQFNFVEIPLQTFYLSDECITYANYNQLICKLIFTPENKFLVYLFIKINFDPIKILYHAVC